MECSIDTDLLSKLHRRQPRSKREASVECEGRCARLLGKVLQCEGRGQASAHISLNFARYRVLERSRRGLEKPEQLAKMRIVVRPEFGVAEPHQGAAISARDGKARHTP